MAKDKTAKVNGQTLKHGERVTLVIQATVVITDRPQYGTGTTVRYVSFESDEDSRTYDAQWFEADRPDEGKKGHTLSSTTIVRTKP